jgi:hypothetical protein
MLCSTLLRSRKPRPQRTPRWPSRVRPEVETLELRCVPTIIAGPSMNITQFPGNQNEPAITMNPTNPLQLFEISNDEFLASGAGGLMAAFSVDGGVTWTREFIGTGTDALPAACCDPQAVFDEFGNLFVSYLSFNSGNEGELLLSTDSGYTFKLLDGFAASDRPKLAVGAGNVWVSYNDGTEISVSGARVSGLGSVGAFTPPQQLQGSHDANFGEMAIGPNGQVVVVASEPTTVTTNAPFDAGPDVLLDWVNLTGVGGTFGLGRVIGITQVGQQFSHIAAQSNSFGIDSEPQLAWDLSGGPFNGRVYVTYTDAPSPASVTTDLFERFSDDNGVTWSRPIKINDNTVPDAVFLPSLAIDPVTGTLAIQFYDTRMDQGQGGPLDPSGSALDDTQVWASASSDGGVSWNNNVQISAGTSSSSLSEKSIPADIRPSGFGDYLQSSAFFNGVWYPVWADNSNSTGDNPDGVLHQMDIYTARVTFLPLGVGRSAPDSFSASLWTSWNPNVHWSSVVTGDFNGDGKTDIAGFLQQTGQWWVGISDGSSFTTSLWTTWNPNVTWVDMRVGDFNGDDKMDIAGRVLESGQWWVGQSNGSSFTNALWTTWNPNVTWVDVNAGDFNGHGKIDIIGRVLQSGQWWVAQSNGFSFANGLWTTWSPAVNWVDVNVGDYNGDGRADITGRVLQSGQWWTSVSNGSGFDTSLWATWNPNVTWVDVQVGDFNGDGKADIVGRVLQTGQWWVVGGKMVMEEGRAMLRAPIHRPELRCQPVGYVESHGDLGQRQSGRLQQRRHG